MPTPNASSKDGTDTDAAGDLPLFRPEAIAAQQQRFYGEIILIQPLSITLLTTLAVVLGGMIFGLIVFGYHTESVRVSGILTVDTGSGIRRPLGYLYVPARAMRFVHVGKRLSIECSACTPKRERGTVREVSAMPLQPEEIESESGVLPKQPVYRVTVVLDGRHGLPSGAKIESEFALERQPLLKWLFEDSPNQGR